MPTTVSATGSVMIVSTVYSLARVSTSCQHDRTHLKREKDQHHRVRGRLQQALLRETRRIASPTTTSKESSPWRVHSQNSSHTHTKALAVLSPSAASPVSRRTRDMHGVCDIIYSDTNARIMHQKRVRSLLPTTSKYCHVTDLHV
jgi:hypothetical protein